MASRKKNVLRRRKTFRAKPTNLPKLKRPELGNFLNRSHPPFLKLAYAGFLIGIATIVFVILFRNNLPPEVPLFYGSPRGQDQLSPELGLLIPSLISITIVFVNTTLAHLTKDDFLAKTLIVASFIAILFSTITTLKIVFLVGSI